MGCWNGECGNVRCFGCGILGREGVLDFGCLECVMSDIEPFSKKCVFCQDM